MVDLLFYKVASQLALNKNVNDGLQRLNIVYLRDLLFHQPTSYQIRNLNPNLNSLENNQLVQVDVEIQEVKLSPRPDGRNFKVRKMPSQILAETSNGPVLLIFFSRIQPFILKKLLVGSKHTISGKVQNFNGMPQIIHPDFITDNNIKKSIFEPIYNLTYGINNRQILSYMIKALSLIKMQIVGITDPVVRTFLDKFLSQISIIHVQGDRVNLTNYQSLIQDAKEWFSRQEIYANQLSLLNLRQNLNNFKSAKFNNCEDWQKTVLNQLNLTLTNCQHQAIIEIAKEQNAPRQMLKLLQGDVGSGKTLVALISMLKVVKSNYQAALMVPTDLLANQHYHFFLKAMLGLDIKIILLTGSISAKNKTLIYEKIENGEVDIVIGTHAIFQKKVNFKNLKYIIVDEQHKFGVEQRFQLIAKSSDNPDFLGMTATPIPRSLVLTMFGDMTVSNIETKPSNRLPIITKTITINKLEEVISSLASIVAKDEKIYWICPLVESNEESDQPSRVVDVTTRTKAIEAYFPGKVRLIHGKMKSLEKDNIMASLKSGKFNILVATTVIEVGIDISDATLIIIENAENFGLAQLHQLRGRVGRGNIQSYCILLYNPKYISQVGRRRLEIMKETSDGFYIAEQDLILRGGGDLLGVKQSGEPEFYFADIVRDSKYIEDMQQELNVRQNESESEKTLGDLKIKIFNRNKDQILAKIS